MNSEIYVTIYRVMICEKQADYVRVCTHLTVLVWSKQTGVGQMKYECRIDQR